MKDSLALSGQTNPNFAPIPGGGLTNDGAAVREAIDQFDGAVMAELEAIGKLADGGEFSRGESFDGQEKLMLLRLDAVGAGGILAIAEEFADPVAEFGEVTIGGNRKISRRDRPHIYIVSR